MHANHLVAQPCWRPPRSRHVGCRASARRPRHARPRSRSAPRSRPTRATSTTCWATGSSRRRARYPPAAEVPRRLERRAARRRPDPRRVPRGRRRRRDLVRHHDAAQLQRLRGPVGARRRERRGAAYRTSGPRSATAPRCASSSASASRPATPTPGGSATTTSRRTASPGPRTARPTAARPGSRTTSSSRRAVSGPPARFPPWPRRATRSRRQAEAPSQRSATIVTSSYCGESPTKSSSRSSRPWTIRSAGASRQPPR